MTKDDALFMLRQRGYFSDGDDWLQRCILRGQAGADVGVELALILFVREQEAEEGYVGSSFPIPKRGPGRPRKVEA